ncbi:uncharacterized protein [Nicotiana tomentosiformis]|uniref:uncharacterized protein n=1 Tax=Nicotiana tomentosiformis TaxID=4098 RepID=UPI00388CB5DB
MESPSQQKRDSKQICISHEKRTQQMLTGESIRFGDEDADRLTISHNDALVITLRIFDTDMRRVLIDPGSSANIIQSRVVEEMELIGQIIPKVGLLSGFNNSVR